MTRSHLLRFAYGIAATLLLAPAAQAVHPLEDGRSPQTAIQTEVLHAMLPAGGSRHVKATHIDLAPGATLAAQGHQVSAAIYVLQGEVEYRPDQSSTLLYRAGASWWQEATPAHRVVRNASAGSGAKLLIFSITP